MNKSTILFLVIFIMIFSFSTYAADFKDIDGHWAKEAITSMTKTGIISGYPDGSFKPDETLTREQFAKLISLTFNLPKSDSKNTFSDVKTSDWSYEYIESSKEFLTGYFPPYGQAFFLPQTNATREDVAVSLVRTLKIEDDVNEDILKNNFKDYDQISPNIRKEVAQAINNDLLKGFPDKTFRPMEPVTRGQVATLLYRILKNSYTSGSQEIELNIELPEITYNSVLGVKGTITKNAKLKINGTECNVKDGIIDIELLFRKGEGEYSFIFEATLNNKTKSVKKLITYVQERPELEINCPEIVNNNKVVIKGKVTDKEDYDPKIIINGKEAFVNNGEFEHTVILYDKETDINIIAKNKNNKSTILTKKVIFNAPNPVLFINDIQETTDKDKVLISGYSYDNNDKNINLSINDNNINLNEDGIFIQEINLIPGANNIIIKAKNKFDKTTQEIKTINYNIPIPEEQIIEEVKEVEKIPEYSLIIDETTNSITGYTGTPINIEIPENIVKIEARAFQNCESLESIVIPDTCNTLGNSAFANCTNLKSIKLPETLTNINAGLLSGCVSLETVNIPEAVTKIMTEAFRYCTFKEITIPKNVELIQSHVFRECDRLTDVYFTGEAPYMQSYVFSYVDPFPNILIPEGLNGYDANWFKSIEN